MQATALLVIDAQTGLIDGDEMHDPVWEGERLLKNIGILLRKARDAFVPVIFVQDDDVAPPESVEWRVHPLIAPVPGEASVRKVATDAFHGTDLDEKLRRAGITRLVIAGCKTEYCIDTACRRATTLGYQVILAADAHSTTDNGVLAADRIVAHHNHILNGLDNVEAEISTLPVAEITF
ncbi:nicotinamidase-related amidase [Melghirimyces profundicolus]|uniref:Nicotinamidase-related amidase n=1 Tax=Melghirimyces profundicolus TaxID=1242148 RepID=A0A2T6BSP6_9BACL|nr:cysteine hydrolase family protein [Melghirimyces profundicolus]PTX59092.1 nicotinamidase-related amidase [Melghirimyces profundicolus]